MKNKTIAGRIATRIIKERRLKNENVRYRKILFK